MSLREVVTTALDVLGLLALAVGVGLWLAAAVLGNRYGVALGVGVAAGALVVMVVSALWQADLSPLARLVRRRT